MTESATLIESGWLLALALLLGAATVWVVRRRAARYGIGRGWQM